MDGTVHLKYLHNYFKWTITIWNIFVNVYIRWIIGWMYFNGFSDWSILILKIISLISFIFSIRYFIICCRIVHTFIFFYSYIFFLSVAWIRIYLLNIRYQSIIVALYFLFKLFLPLRTSCILRFLGWYPSLHVWEQLSNQPDILVFTPCTYLGDLCYYKFCQYLLSNN